MSNFPHNEERLKRIKKIKSRLIEILDLQKKRENGQLDKIMKAKTGQPIELTGYIVYDKDGNDTGKRFLRKEDAEDYVKALKEADKTKIYENKIKEN